MPEQLNICAIIVTFNRKALLMKCLSEVQDQMRGGSNILIVDNASSDGTSLAVSRNYPDAQVLSLKENVGGAGGFAAGIQHAMKRGYDAFWLMDDDGFPGRLCLDRLCSAMKNHNLDVAAPAVITSEQSEELSFGLNVGSRLINRYPTLQEACGKEGLIHQDANFFNGILVNRSVVDAIGKPDENLFIRGDEVEYFFRIQRAKLNCATLVSATFIHPSGSDGKHALIGNRFIACYTGHQLKDYCTYRNRAFIHNKYGRQHRIVLDLLRYVYFFTFKRLFDLGGLRFWLGASIDGITGRFGKEREFLPKTKQQTT